MNRSPYPAEDAPSDADESRHPSYSSASAADTKWGMIAASTAAVMFGTAVVATSFQLRSFTPTSAAAWRGVVGAVVLLAIISLRPILNHRNSSTRSTPNSSTVKAWERRRRLFLLGVLGGPIFLVGMNVAVSEIGATITGFVIALYSTFASVIAPLILKEPLRGQALVGLALALVGTALLAELSIEETSASGMVAGLMAAIGYALYLVLGRRWSRAFQLQPERIAFSASATTAITLMAWLAIVNPAVLVPGELRTDALVALMWLGFVMGAGQFLVMISARRVHARVSASMLLLNPITAAVLGVTVLGEALNPIQLSGGILVLVGMGAASGLFALMGRQLRSA